MKFKVTMKDPDTLGDAVSDAVADDLKKVEGLTDYERDILQDTRRDEVMAVVAKWFEYGEYLTVEIDTDAGTAIVCSKK